MTFGEPVFRISVTLLAERPRHLKSEIHRLTHLNFQFVHHRKHGTSKTRNLQNTEPPKHGNSETRNLQAVQGNYSVFW